MDVGHLPYAGFIAGVETVGAVELGRDDFAFPDEFIQSFGSIPVGGERMAIGDDLVGRTIEGDASPFAVEQIEVQASLLGEGERIPFITEFEIDAVLALGVDQFHKIDERFILPFF